ncbi:hypothetical protein K488DRAFT_56501 [Vararia minispora EC-137]|uniref:Uncharacterized protein n=1 Tax=Vararia minispora EC-137 TaxID=1314806 RepID=A0ACB8QC70_9AGAM|nr:hypothetical protein K488DRAFT_56501 [Vararia minispora EC-137]
MHASSFYEQEEWDLERILARGQRFRPIPRVSVTDEGQSGELTEALEKYRALGIPLVIEDLHMLTSWPSELFSAAWFQENSQQALDVWEVNERKDIRMSIGDFFEYCRSPRLSGSGYPTYYAKDAQCPQEWRHWLLNSGLIPAELIPLGTDDLLKHLPLNARPETLMCYLGIGGTFTPCHKDLCGSSGHNLMVYTENSGSAFWFMTKGEDAPAVAKYFRADLGQMIDWENHAITIDELSAAPFDVFICEQKLGDFVLVPPRSCHQVVNHGGLTIKLSWSRVTLKGAEIAFYHELPLYRRVCRTETYRIKSLIHHAVRLTTNQCESALSGQPGQVL